MLEGKALDEACRVFQAMDLGPMHPNPKINELYIKLRLMGCSEEETKNLINQKLSEIK